MVMRLRRRSNPAAFTLLELILVMLILCGMAALAIPHLVEFSKGKAVDHCATQVLAMANWAQTQAVSRGVNYRLNIDEETGEYWLSVQNYEGTGYEYLGEDFGRIRTPPDDVAIRWLEVPQQEDGTYVQFSPSGRTSPAIIYIEDANGRKRMVACLSATERFRILSDAESIQLDF